MVSNNSFAPPKSTVADIVAEGDIIKASRGIRLGAVLLDALIFSIFLTPSYVMAGRQIASAGGFAAGPAATAMGRAGVNPFATWFAVAATGPWFYIGALINLALLIYTAILVQRNGQTIAKKLLGIKVVRSDGSKASLGRIFWLRNVVNGVITIIPLLGSLYALIDCLFIFGEAKRCCHDYIADTIVVQA